MHGTYFCGWLDWKVAGLRMAATMAATPWLCLWVAWWEAQEEERRGWGEGVGAGMLVVAFEIGGGCLAVAGVEIQWGSCHGCSRQGKQWARVKFASLLARLLEFTAI